MLKLYNHASISPDSHTYLLCLKLCRHDHCIPTPSVTLNEGNASETVDNLLACALSWSGDNSLVNHLFDQGQ